MLPYSRVRTAGSYSDMPRTFSIPTFSIRPGSSYCRISPPPQRFSIAQVIGASIVIVFALNVSDHAIPVDVEWLPPTLRSVPVDAHGGNPVAVADAPEDHRIPRLEPACGRNCESAG